MRAVVLALLGATLAGPATAQDAGEDWDLTEDAQQQLTLASLDFGTNQLAVRCRAGMLDFLLVGVPPTDEESRRLRVTVGAIQNEDQSWYTSPGQPIASPAEPARLARQLRAGGELDIRLEAAAGERARRYRLPVPPSTASLDRVLSACSVPLVDDWDLRPRAGSELIVWADQPSPDFPDLAQQHGVESGVVRLGCIVAAGGALNECHILSESPADAGFGRSAVRAAERARLGLPEDESTVIGKVISFTIRFRVA